jgi:putative transposase
VKRKRFAVGQITAILKQAELRAPIAELCRQHGISEQSFYRWTKTYGGMKSSEARQLKQLREENGKLKRLVADLSLDKVMLQDVLQKSGEARQATRGRGLLNGRDRIGAKRGCRAVRDLLLIRASLAQLNTLRHGRCAFKFERRRNS